MKSKVSWVTSTISCRMSILKLKLKGLDFSTIPDTLCIDCYCHSNDTIVTDCFSGHEKTYWLALCPKLVLFMIFIVEAFCPADPLCLCLLLESGESVQWTGISAWWTSPLLHYFSASLHRHNDRDFNTLPACCKLQQIFMYFDLFFYF